MFPEVRNLTSDISNKDGNAYRFGKVQIVTATGAVLVAANEMAFANASDFSTMTAGINFSSVITAVMAVGLAVAGALVALRGVRLVLSAIRG